MFHIICICSHPFNLTWLRNVAHQKFLSIWGDRVNLDEQNNFDRTLDLCQNGAKAHMDLLES